MKNSVWDVYALQFGTDQKIVKVKLLSFTADYVELQGDRLVAFNETRVVGVFNKDFIVVKRTALKD